MTTLPISAIFALLAIQSRAPLAPDPDSETLLSDADLVAYNGDGSMLELTGKGTAFCRMLEATPLPVRVERWDDPRGEAAPAAPQVPANGLADLAKLLLAAAGQTAIMAPAAAGRPAAPVTTMPPIPPGYSAVPEEWSALPVGQWPSVLRADHMVTVMWRDGRIKTQPVQSTIWTHRGKIDDVIAYRLGDASDTMIPVISAPVN